jgi:hypothetical protein
MSKYKIKTTILRVPLVGLYLLLLLPKANSSIKGVGCHPKLQSKVSCA